MREDYKGDTIYPVERQSPSTRSSVVDIGRWRGEEWRGVREKGEEHHSPVRARTEDQCSSAVDVGGW